MKVQKTMQAIGVFLWLLFGLYGPAMAADKDLLLFYPLDKSATTTVGIRAVGMAPKGVDTVQIRLTQGNSSEVKTAKVENNGFGLFITLQPGMNTIELMNGAKVEDSRGVFLQTKNNIKSTPKGFENLFYHSKNELTENCAECHITRRRGKADFSRINPVSTCNSGSCHQDIGKGKFVHGPIGGKTCVACHNPHGSRNEGFMSRQGSALCYVCHTNEEERFSKVEVGHFPVQEGECLACHDPHQSNAKFQLREPTVGELCAKCHGVSKTKHKYLHGPVGAGDCVACHKPHGSAFPNLLIGAGNDLCFICHKDRQEEFKRKNIHNPVAKDCGLCHDPHGSGSKFQLRTALNKQGEYEETGESMTAACFTCHKKLHPELYDAISKATVQHKPVAEGKCTACHTPHSTNYSKQLKAPLKDLCFNCHLEMGEIVVNSSQKHGPVQTNDCAECHKVHGSPNTRLLLADFPEEFYTPYVLEKYDVCFSCHNDQIAEQRLSQETEFRNGKVNLHFLHINREKGRSCKACHEVHAGEQDKHIREEVPFGKGWSYPITFTKTPHGGNCVVGCHKPKDYDREKPVSYK